MISSNPAAGIFTRAALPLLAVLVAAGCGRGVYEAASLDEEQARETLTSALESWKQGDSQESLQERSPPTLVMDPDWMGGAKLLNFQIPDEGEELEGRLVIQVTLTLQDERGGPTEKTVTYLVNTSPALAVLRDIRR
jgi:hypothetical protein